MKALILNSGIGKRMGELTKTTNKCMAQIAEGQSILDLQLQKIEKAGIKEVVITTGPFADKLAEYVTSNYPNLTFTFVHNPIYDQTNYIYSIALAKEELHDDIILMHGDLVFQYDVFQEMLQYEGNAMVVDSTLPLPEKDFKAVVLDGKIRKVGIEFFDHAYAAQPLYKWNQKDWEIWLNKIVAFCEAGTTNCYAENAMNEVSDEFKLDYYDVKGRVCTEVDNLTDLANVQKLYDKIK